MLVESPPENFERQVRDCLAHLYDFTELQSNPLSGEIAPDLTGLQRVEMVRRVLIETVDQLKARETVGLPSKQDRVYSILLMRYVEGLTIPEVVDQLSLSERQFYREHQRAIQAVSQLLWDRLKGSQPRIGDMSVKSEMRRLSRQSSYIALDVEGLLLGAIEANANLAVHHGITIHLRPLQTLDDFNAHQAVLRQTVIWMLSQIITHVSMGSEIALSAAITENDLIAGDLVINFEISNTETDLLKLQGLLTENPMAVEFMSILKGQITTAEADESSYRVQLRLVRQRQVILVIDDNPDAVNLLERYITGMPYEIVSSPDPEEGFRMAQNLEPLWIVLDIMLPNTDGWKMLQNLKSHPKTLSIPILVCSVLDNPDLAVSLGANAYLKKPPDRLSFLEALRL
jgi:CheY-like chemotaxis protein